MPECPFLANCARRFEEAGRAFEALVAGIGPRQASWKPGPKKWSVAECIDHLNVAAGLYFPRMEEAIERGREDRLLGQAPFRQWSFLGWFILRALDPEARHRVRAPGAFRPAPGSRDFGDLCADFRAALARFGDLAEAADGLDLGRIRLATPVAPFPRLTLAEAFELHTLHIPRHLAQAKRVTETAGYPAPAA